MLIYVSFMVIISASGTRGIKIREPTAVRGSGRRVLARAAPLALGGFCGGRRGGLIIAAIVAFALALRLGCLCSGLRGRLDLRGAAPLALRSGLSPSGVLGLALQGGMRVSGKKRNGNQRRDIARTLGGRPLPLLGASPVVPAAAEEPAAAAAASASAPVMAMGL